MGLFPYGFPLKQPQERTEPLNKLSQFQSRLQENQRCVSTRNLVLAHLGPVDFEIPPEMSGSWDASGKVQFRKLVASADSLALVKVCCVCCRWAERWKMPGL